MGSAERGWQGRSPVDSRDRSAPEPTPPHPAPPPPLRRAGPTVGLLPYMRSFGVVDQRLLRARPVQRGRSAVGAFDPFEVSSRNLAKRMQNCTNLAMPDPYIPRSLEPVLAQAVREFPAVVLTGPRQAGKTTVLRRLFSDRWHYASLEIPDIRQAALEDPRGFLDAYAPPAIFDEVHYAPDLLAYVKEKIDTDRDRRGQYILTGSQNLLLLETVSETLAGRAAVLRLLPLSRREIDGRPAELLPWEREGRVSSPPTMRPVPELWHELLRGSYPELARSPERDAQLWYGSYVQTYLERDVRAVRQVGDLTEFQSFLRALAARSANLLSLSELARDLGIAQNTVKAWISVLEATHQIIVLRPYFANIGKRLVKTPKVYFTDTGLLAYLVGLSDPAHAASSPMSGAIVETAVLTEIVKSITHRGLQPGIYFWRTSSGTEVDFIVETQGTLVPIEVKASATPRPQMASSIHAFRKDLGDRALPGYVVHLGDVRLPLGSGVAALPLVEL